MKYLNPKGSKGVNILKKEWLETPQDIEEIIYTKCEGCALKTGEADRYGTHCGHVGRIRVRGNKCAERK